MSDTRATLLAWNAAPGPVLRAWTLLALAVAAALLTATWFVALVTTPDHTPLGFPGLGRTPADAAAIGYILVGNALVLALHALACVAGYLAGRSLPEEAQRHSGLMRTIHERAGSLAMAFVAAATIFSLVTQAHELGGAASTLAEQLGVTPGVLVLALLPHALPELVALFLPLAAWLVAARRERWHELLAATAVTVAIAIPVLVLAALIEVHVTPDILRGLAT
ncbi:MAG TPA: hypothetical protein VGW11_05095 [Solirubrobacteraceae bacterium]|nr:hypothetical protein [Solirubrobacteraceae bacterium]